MSIHRVKFIWGSSGTIKGQWRLGLFCRYTSRAGFPGSGLALSLRGLLGWALAAVVLAYAGTVFLVARSLRGVPAGELSWADWAAWPVRRAQRARLRGHAWAAQGRAAIAAQRYGEGFFLLRQALAGDPGDAGTRLTLAQLNLLAGDRANALALLAAAPRFGRPDAAWLHTAIEIGRDGEDWDFILQLIDACLPRVDPSALAERGELTAAKAEALVGLGRGPEALELLRTAPVRSELVRIREARTLLALGRAEEAAAALAAWRREVPHLPEIAFQIEARAWRQAGKWPEFERTLDSYRATGAGEARPAAFAVVERARAGRGAAAALDDYLFRFGSEMENYRLVAEPLAEVPAVPLLARLVAAAREHGFSPRPVEVEFAVGLLRQGDFPALARLLGEIEPEFSAARADGRAWFVWIQKLSLALNSTEAGAQGQVVEAIASQPLSLVASKDAIAALRRAGRPETAARVVAVARRRFAANMWLAQQDRELQRELAALAEQAAKSAPPAVLREEPVDADAFFSQLDRAVAAGQWPEARDQIGRLRARRTPPPWLAERDTDLLRRELRIEQALGDALALRLAAKLLLNGGPERIDELLDFARAFDAKGDRASALALARLVHDRYPGNVKVAALLKQWQPRTVPGEP